MPYITRDDGERFVIPSYRDVMPARNKSALKRDVILLSKNYGEYITMQRKNAAEYEVAFSPDVGYLLGESIWHHFKRPIDFIYCEAIPNTTEVILVVVKAGAVYLDGTFPTDSVAEELVVFLTQQNNFDIYIHGEVPISQMPQVGKFSFDMTSVKSFTVLDQPIFQTLPLLKIYQLRLVDTVLKAHGIGVLPLKQIVVGAVIIGVLWMGYSYLATKSEIIQQIVQTENPYQGYFDILTTPDPSREMIQLLPRLERLYAMPGWTAQSINYVHGSLIALVKSNGAKIEDLSNWAKPNDATVDVKSDGIYITMVFFVVNRPQPDKIYLLSDVISKFIDNLSSIYPGNRLQMGTIVSKGVYKSVIFTITLDNVSPSMLALIGTEFANLPFVMRQMNLALNNGSFSGSITMEAAGN
ncbi:MAG: hypothetical protein A3F42_02205 [Gammaproteobacteria bacterium RIFCSPHIGHO2_12_FULL_37_34]|nr:MAG: hypothetical protein A3F42_02205 [Gammaproteobacteria bacterium RIFCSPHIGHO2_12_FULL_37_34]